jgi:hypothetical protein
MKTHLTDARVEMGKQCDDSGPSSESCAAAPLAHRAAASLSRENMFGSYQFDIVLRGFISSLRFSSKVDPLLVKTVKFISCTVIHKSLHLAT